MLWHYTVENNLHCHKPLQLFFARYRASRIDSWIESWKHNLVNIYGKSWSTKRVFIPQTVLADKDAASDAAPDNGQLPNHSAKLNNLSTTTKQVPDIPTSQPRRKAPGLDGITTDLSKLYSSWTANNLAVLFNCSFSEEVYPSAWEDSLVVHVFKREDRA